MVALVFLATLSLSSAAFHQGGSIPPRYTCEGRDVSPPLRWSHVPQRTRTLALRLDDPDAPGGTFTHWTIWNLPPTKRTIAAGVKWTFQGQNSFGRIGYGGPCPPAGQTHHYVFWLFALNARLTLRRGATRAQFGAAIRGHIVATAKLVGIYRR